MERVYYCLEGVIPYPVDGTESKFLRRYNSLDKLVDDVYEELETVMWTIEKAYPSVKIGRMESFKEFFTRIENEIVNHGHKDEASVDWCVDYEILGDGLQTYNAKLKVWSDKIIVKDEPVAPPPSRKKRKKNCVGS